MDAQSKTLIIQKREELRVISQEMVDLIAKTEFSPQDDAEVYKKLIHIGSLISIISTELRTDANFSKLAKLINIACENWEQRRQDRKGFIMSLCIVLNTIPFSYSRWPSFFKTDLSIASLELHK